jgi:hypothetical protein
MSAFHPLQTVRLHDYAAKLGRRNGRKGTAVNWPRIALIVLLLVSFVGLVLPWVTGIDNDQWPTALRWAFVGAILVAMAILGRDERRRDKAADPWVDDPRKSKRENWLQKRRQRFSPRRGLEFFLMGLFVFSIMVAVSAVMGTVASIGGAIAFVLGVSAVAGLIGMFTEKVPL